MTSLYVINSRGEKELFSFQKVYESAMRVGASKELARLRGVEFEPTSD